MEIEAVLTSNEPRVGLFWFIAKDRNPSRSASISRPFSRVAEVAGFKTLDEGHVGMTRDAGVEGLMAIDGALPEIAKLLAVPLDEIAVIDDGDNVIAMFGRSGLSISMDNASPQVRQGADDGFANAVEQFILGGGRSNAHDGIARAGVPAW